MSKVKDTFFGGAEKDAARAQRKGFEAAGKLTAEQLATTEAEFAPFTGEGGGLAFEQQQAISGALGPEAQAAAFEAFQEDPGTQFLREQGLRLIESGAGAVGGLGGGDRLRELTKFSQGLALQDLSNRFGQLGTVAGTGLTAVGNVANLRAGLGAQQGASITGAAGAKASGITAGAAGLRAGLQQVASGVAGTFGGGGAKGFVQGFAGV